VQPPAASAVEAHGRRVVEHGARGEDPRPAARAHRPIELTVDVTEERVEALVGEQRASHTLVPVEPIDPVPRPRAARVGRVMHGGDHGALGAASITQHGREVLVGALGRGPGRARERLVHGGRDGHHQRLGRHRDRAVAARRRVGSEGSVERAIPGVCARMEIMVARHQGEPLRGDAAAPEHLGEHLELLGVAVFGEVSRHDHVLGAGVTGALERRERAPLAVFGVDGARQVERGEAQPLCA
jgi:hypothetical protein